jgi:hypothetical protein
MVLVHNVPRASERPLGIFLWLVDERYFYYMLKKGKKHKVNFYEF